ncbi:hypothetical protein A5906_05320 [Bradyrhizobium sacchari]|uniref:Uncharacterized protein n=1 Tax=Bradyrhizobium sacchari TaxID=1399419 RepID=A0A560JEV0_9BRAD|nr:hypothetical protein [Bradyrhizobium sacchari]OPY96004.1 hypothetical protein A5906_05320 [Bradyrhizobium sacchari]TWB51263.1 hypothetical protein FBZ94_11093 [Bradyrhizobium sacchari]TWB69497.1 hypothetical protein FBZ95_10993 [Bradyrhizobium sacchari]
MDRFNTINPADNGSIGSDAIVEQPQAAFDQHLADVREAGPLYPHAELYDVTEEDDRLIQAASRAALERGHPSSTTVSIYDRRLRQLADGLKQSGKSISGLDDDTLLAYARKLLPKDKVIAPALFMVSRYREPDANAHPLSTHYRPSREDERLIRDAAEAGFGRKIAPTTANGYASGLRKLAAALRPSSIAKLSDDTLLGHADRLFPKDKTLIAALNGLRDYRAITPQNNLAGEGGSSRQVIQPSVPSPMPADEQPIGSVADGRGSLPPGFNAPQAWPAMGLAAHSPIESVAQDVLFDAADGENLLPATMLELTVSSMAHSPVQSVAQDALFDAAERENLLPPEAFDTPAPWPTMSPTVPSPVQSVPQEALFDAAERENLLPAEAFDTPVPWLTMSPTVPSPVQSVAQEMLFDAAAWQPSSPQPNSASEDHSGRMMNQGAAAQTAVEQTFAAAGDAFDASLSVPEDFSHGTQAAPKLMRTRLGRWGLLPDAAQRVKTYDICGERYTAALGPGGLDDVQLVHLRSPAIGDTFDVSFAVPENFSHRTQLAPDRMLSTLGKWDFLPVEEHPIMNYEIGGERYTAILGPEGPNDVQLIHHPRPALPGEATPAAPRTSSDIYGDLAPGFASPAPFESGEDAPWALAPNLPLPSAGPASGHQPVPQVPELGGLLGDGWTHASQEASPAVINILQSLGLLPSRDILITVFSIHGQFYTAESLPGGRVLLFHQPQFG